MVIKLATTRLFFLVPVLPQPLLSLMCSYFMSFPLLTTWHRTVVLNVLNVVNVFINRILKSRIIH